MLLPCFRHFHHFHCRYNCTPRFICSGRAGTVAASSLAFFQELYSHEAPSLDRCTRRSASSLSSAAAVAMAPTSDDDNATTHLPEGKKSKGQKKREALRAVDWAITFSSFSDSQLRRAMRWGDLQEEVFEAVKVAKKIGRDGKHARRRQLNLIGGMLRGMDPELMEAIIKAIKDGDVNGLFNKSTVSDGANDIEESESCSSEEDSSDEDNVNDTVERWFEGLLSGDSDVLAEIYSIRSAEFNRQELRHLLREVSKGQIKSQNRRGEDGIPEDHEGESESRDVVESKAKLREYLTHLVKISND